MQGLSEETMELTLTLEEREFLLNILEQRHRDLLNEIWHTDCREFKLALRQDEKMLDSILSRLREMPVPQASG
jgi:hypothetical protein